MIASNRFPNTTAHPSAVRLSAPNILLRLEGLALFSAAVAAYIHFRGSGVLFAVLLLTPDLTFAAYLINPRVGAWGYNIAHWLPMPLALTAFALATGDLNALLIALIWFAHIGMDRTVGYGLKYPSAFKDTHMGRV
ncbi:MAG: DUF4260 domain-containing protein [Chloroflexota bacterium]|nr:DUF4260 domain-containing protein [Chloroflexota bacterium]